MDAQPSRLDVIADGPGRLLTLDGVIDSHTAPTLDDRFTDLGTDGDVTIDLAGVDFVDSSGLRSIVAAHSRLDAAGSRLYLRAASEPVQRLLMITKLDAHLNVL